LVKGKEETLSAAPASVLSGDSLTRTSNGCQDFIRGLGSTQRLRVGVVRGDLTADRVPEFAGAVVDATAEMR
jgi:hypothetical protein